MAVVLDAVLSSKETSATPGFPVEITAISTKDESSAKSLNLPICAQCEKICRDPVQGSCGHRFCQLCIDFLLRANENPTCPGCQKEGVEEIICKDQVFPDFFCRRELNKLNVRCINNGCDWHGIFKDYAKHNDECPWFLVQCKTCDKLWPRYEVAYLLHLSAQALIPASLFHARLFISSIRSIHHFHRTNPGEKHSFNLEAHQQTHRKLKDGDDCPFGCGAKIEDVNDIEAHVSQGLSAHLRVVHKRLDVIEDNLNRRNSHGEQLTQQQSTTLTASPRSEILLTLQTRLDQLESTINKSMAELTKASSTSAGAADSLTGSGRRPLVGAAAASGADDEIEMDRLTMLEQVGLLLSREVAKLSERQGQVEQTDGNYARRLKEAVDKADAAEKLYKDRELRLKELDEQLTTISMTSYDGTFIWRISDVARRRREAKAGTAVSITSPAFYTSRTGYKMHLRIYLNGDGAGRSTHISIYFLLARGNYDPVLPWPFHQQVSLTLIDQSTTSDVLIAHTGITVTFQPDSGSFYQRPTNDMNMPIGFPTFVPFSTLDSAKNGYVRDDVMFIKASVDRTKFK